MNEIATHLPDTRSATEQRWREELAACYRLVAHFRMTDLIFTHISVRLPGPEHHFLINPYGLMFDEITASNLVKIDLNGHAVEPSPFPVNPAGFVIHSAIHGAREDAQCVLHTHTKSGCAVAALKCGLLPVNQISMEFYGRVAYHDYEGLLTLGETVSQAFLRMYYLEKACEIQLAAQAAGELVLPPAEVCEHTERQFNDPGRALEDGELSDPDAMQLAWAALLRLLDRVAPGYRD
jgi:ribulose-5-phosphate 4-epimerase/fuculose-1-phosphate aldolase